MLSQMSNCFLERDLSWTTAFASFERTMVFCNTLYYKSFFFSSSLFLPLVTRYLFKWKLNQILPPLCWLPHKNNSVKIRLATQTVLYLVIIGTTQICFQAYKMKKWNIYIYFNHYLGAVF